MKEFKKYYNMVTNESISYGVGDLVTDVRPSPKGNGKVIAVSPTLDLSIIWDLDNSKETINSKDINFIKKMNESSIDTLKISDIDHTRIIKWLGNNFDYNTYTVKKSNDGYTIDTTKLSKNDIDNLKKYLKSQEYLKESDDDIIEISYQDLNNECQRSLKLVLPAISYIERVYVVKSTMQIHVCMYINKEVIIGSESCYRLSKNPSFFGITKEGKQLVILFQLDNLDNVIMQ